MPRKLITIITPRTGQWFITTKFDKELEATLYDPGHIDDPENDDKLSPLVQIAANVPSLIILVWPYGRGLIKLRWTEFVPDLETAQTATVKNRMTRKIEKKYKSYQTFFNSSLVIGTREEWVNYLNKVEVHPAVAEITSEDGGGVEFVLDIAFEVLNPILTQTVENFIGYGTSFVLETFRLWGADKKFKLLRSVSTVDDKDIPHEIHDRLKILNDTDFTKKGFRIARVAVVATPVAERSKDLLESEEKITKAANKAASAVFEKEAELEMNKAQENRNKIEIDFRREDAQIKIGLVKETSEGLAKVNAAWGGPTGLDRLYIAGSNPAQALVESHLQVQDFADSDSDERRKKPSQNNKKTNEKKGENEQ